MANTSFSGIGSVTHKGDFACVGDFDFPIVIKQNVMLDDLQLIGYSEITSRLPDPRSATVHFFEDDYRFDEVWNNPSKYVSKLKVYRQVLSPDFSQYTDMPVALQVFNVYRNRWCAAYWQRQGLVVIPTITWSDTNSFYYSFDSIQKESCVAISTVGCAENKTVFMDGYIEMVKQIAPELVLCYGKLFSGMTDFAKCVEVEYRKNEKISLATKD